MPALCKITMEWYEAPDEITPKILGQLRGICIQKAREEFKKRGFPKFDIYRAKKSELMKYYNIKLKKDEDNETTNSLLQKILEVLVDAKNNQTNMEADYGR